MQDAMPRATFVKVHSSERRGGLGFGFNVILSTTDSCRGETQATPAGIGSRRGWGARRARRGTPLVGRRSGGSVSILARLVFARTRRGSRRECAISFRVPAIARAVFRTYARPTSYRAAIKSARADWSTGPDGGEGGRGGGGREIREHVERANSWYTAHRLQQARVSALALSLFARVPAKAQTNAETRPFSAIPFPSTPPPSSPSSPSSMFSRRKRPVVV